MRNSDSNIFINSLLLHVILVVYISRLPFVACVVNSKRLDVNYVNHRNVCGCDQDWYKIEPKVSYSFTMSDYNLSLLLDVFTIFKREKIDIGESEASAQKFNVNVTLF